MMQRALARIFARRMMVRVVLLVLIAMPVAFLSLDALFPPPLHRAQQLSPLVLDRNGHWVHAFTNSDGHWRFTASLEEVDPSFQERLIRIEDKRFYKHMGVDLLATVRAGVTSLMAGRVVSGASTITMQTARLLEPRPRNVGSKLIEMVRALQIEKRLSKDEILSLYLTLTPYGGNVQGVRAASLIWFDKEPALLTPAEQALLIALPQAPEARRPDRRAETARASRRKILDKLVTVGAISSEIAAEASAASLPSRRHAFQRHAWHLSHELKSAHAQQSVINTSLDLTIQQAAERLIANYVGAIKDDATASAIIIDNRSGAVRALIGSSGVDVPGGWIDLTTPLRSPGSTLKPFIYAFAFEDGVLHPDSIIQDMPHSFGGYSPENFDRTFRGEVRIREALQHSLNIPAVMALDQVGTERFTAALDMAGTKIEARRKADGKPGLALALGGAGISLRDIATLYRGLATDGTVRPITYLKSATISEDDQSYRLLSTHTAHTVAEILRGAPSLQGRLPVHLSGQAPKVAFKTGTSYGYRDAWAAGFDDAYTVVVWIGRADGAPRPGKTGRNTAAPLLFSMFDMLSEVGVGGQKLEKVALPAENAPPLPLVSNALRPSRQYVRTQSPEIVFPRDGVELFVQENHQRRGIALAARGGSGETQWYVDGQKLPPDPLGGRYLWYPQEEGFYTVSAVDARGQSSVVTVRVWIRNG